MASSTLKPLLKKLKADSPLEEVIKAAAAQAIEQAKAEGKGIIGQQFAAGKAKEATKEEFRVATKGVKGQKRKILSMFGIEAGGWLDEFEKKASPEEIKEARKKFGLDKKEKSGAANLSKPLSLILRNTIQINKKVDQIAKALSKPSLKSGYTFDPRLGGTGRYVDDKTKKIVSAEKALDTRNQRTSALTAAIGADEQPLVKLKEFLDEKLKDFDPKKLQGSIDSVKFSLNGLTPTLGLLSVHDKLNIIMGQGAIPGMGGRGGRGGRKGRGGRGGRGGRAGGKGGFGLGGLLGAAAGGFLAYQAVDSLRDENLVAEDPEVLKQQAAAAKTPEQKKAVGDQIAAQKRDIKLQAGATAAGGAGAVAGALAVKKVGQTAVVKKVKSKAWDLFVNFVKKRAPKLFAKIGARLALAGGLATVPVLGWVSAAVTVVGSLWLAYDLYQLWKEFSALSDAEKQLYDDKNQKKPGESDAMPAVKPTQPEVAPAAAAAVGAPIAAATPGAVSGGSTVAAATSVATAAPAVALTPSPAAAPPKEEVPASTAVPSMAGAAGKPPPLDQVTTKSPGVDTSGVVPGFKDRVSLMASKFEEVTGKTLMITSGFRSDEKQLQLWNKKVGEIKSQHPDWSDEQVTKAARKWVALPMALGGKGSAHIRGIGIDVNSKGASGIQAIDGQVVDGQRVTVDQFLAKYGLARPLAHEPWHIQPAGATPLPDNPDPSSKPLVADAKGNAVSLESGKPVPMSAEAKASAAAPSLPSVSPASPEPASPAMVAQATPAAASGAVGAAPTATPAAAITPAAPAATAPQMTPAQSQAGQMLAQGSDQLATSQMVAQNAPAPAPVVINQGGGGSQQAPQAPKSPLPKASTRSSEGAFNRALAKDFSHPSAFTTATMI